MHFWHSCAQFAKSVNKFPRSSSTIYLASQAQADVQHLWFGRRAATRVRSQLMAAIYDKALKRKDFSGIVNKDNSKEASDGKKDSKAKAGAEAKEDDPKPGADIGKIVNLMAGDANRVAMTISAMYLIYGSMSCQPALLLGLWLTVSFKVHSRSSLHVSSFTSKPPNAFYTGTKDGHSLLGWSAFAGFLILVLGWPLNSFIAKRSIRIQKGVMAARDKRMGVLNELIAAVCYLSEDSWSDIDLHLTKDQIHQVLCMGGSLDRPCIRRACRRDQVDNQSSSELDPVPTSLVLCSCAGFHYFVPRLCVARE